ncbi:hypothetical protein L204_103853 [Cryptococcus depauperatus]
MVGQLTEEQSARLQEKVQTELERREWAEPNDTVMAEYVTVLLANGSARERVQSEMEDLVGSDFDPAFLDWLFSTATLLDSASAVRESTPSTLPSSNQSPSTTSDNRGNNRLLNSALAPLANQPEKRKLSDVSQEGQNKRLAPDAPTGPKESLASRIGGLAPSAPNSNGQGLSVRGRGMAMRGMAGGRGGMAGHMSGPANGGFQYPPQQQPGFRSRLQMAHPQRFNQMNQGPNSMFGAGPAQQEMMAQMMMMQANMAQMGQMMSMMVEERKKMQQPPQHVNHQHEVRPRPPASVKIPPGTKLGEHTVSSITPKSTVGGIPDKPSSTVLCKFGVGCSNARCFYSHPSPVADERTGMVLSEEPCEKGKDCKDSECIKSHVSPAAVLGGQAGPSRLLCKYQNCTNPSCPFRHEDDAGNLISPPALIVSQKAKTDTSVAPSVANGETDAANTHKGLMDGELEDGPKIVQCRYGEKCTRPNCKFVHPSSRSINTTRKPSRTSQFPSTITPQIAGDMNKSKKFESNGNENKLNPAAVEFRPVVASDADKKAESLNVTL